MVVCDKKAVFPAFFYHVVNTFRRVIALIIRLVFVKLQKMSLIYGICKKIFASVIANGLVIVLVQRYVAQMACFVVFFAAALKYFKFKAVERKKFFVGQVVVRNKNIVIRVCNNAVAVLFVHFFKLLRSTASVRQRGVTVKICFVIIHTAAFAWQQNLFFHDLSPFA